MTGVAEDERRQVVGELERLAAAGHLSAAELADRVRRARTVLTRAGLDGILLDLPTTTASPPPTPTPPSPPSATRPWALPGAPTTPDPLPPAAPPVVPAPATPPTPPAPPADPAPVTPLSPPAAPATGAPPTRVGAVGGGLPPPPWQVATSHPPVGGLPPPPRPAPRAPRPPDPPIRRPPRLSPPPAPGKRHPVVGVLGLSVIAAVSLWAIAKEADDATDDLTGAPDTAAERSDPPAAAVPTTGATTTTSTTVAPTGTTLPHADGWDTIVVGQDVQPGLLMSSAVDEFCDWTRNSTADEGRSNVHQAVGGSVRPVVEVLPTDRVLLARDCGPWVPYAAPDVPATTVGDGDWLVGSDIAPGRYRLTDPVAAHPSDCWWERGRNFRYDLANHLENIGEDRRTVVDLAAGERFSSRFCGTWTRD